METTTHDEAAQAFRSRFGGEVLAPADAGYDEGRAIWNGIIDRHPAVIARCRTTDDVVQAVSLTRESGLPLAVRGGGHSVAGLSTCDGGVVIDLSPMRAVA